MLGGGVDAATLVLVAALLSYAPARAAPRVPLGPPPPPWGNGMPSA